MLKVLYISNEDRAVGGSSVSLKAMLESLKGKVDPVILFREDGPACEYFRKDGYRCEVIPFYRATFRATGWKRILRFIPHAIVRELVQARCVNKARRLFKDIDLVHSNSGTVDIGHYIAWNGLHVPHVWHIREYMDLGLHVKPFWGWKHWHKCLDEAFAVIAISRGLFNHLGLIDHICGICMPDAVCHSDDAILIKEKEPYVVFLAGIVSDVKRPDDAIRIFAKAGLPGHKLKIVGKLQEGMESRIKTIAKECGVEDKLELIPFTDNVKGLLSKAAALLVCTEYEGMGRVSVEAMFYGCPVIARNSGGSADVLEGGKYGQLYDNLDQASKMLRQTVTDTPLEQLEQAEQRAVNIYSIEKYGDKIMKLYNSL